jgi:hypothetical protein
VRLNEPHPSPLKPSWYGDSVGHYEGDTLVIDTVGVKTDRKYAMIDFSGDFWSGHRSDKFLQLHVTIEDAGVFTMPWTATLTYAPRKRPNSGKRLCRKSERVLQQQGVGRSES